MERIPVENAYIIPDNPGSGANPNWGVPTGPMEQVSLTGSEASAPYWVIDSLNLSYQHTGTGDYRYTLYVQERDFAGNWSDSGNSEIWIDTNYTSEPTITRDGTFLRNGDPGNRVVTWDWSTGLGTGGSHEYQYKLLNSSNIEVVDYWNDVTSYTTSGTDPTYDLSNDTTPTWQWTTGSGGIGNYRWSFDEVNWTYTSTTFVTPSLPQGEYTFNIQETDSAGNWSNSAKHYLEIDTTAPTLSSILLNNQLTGAVNRISYTISNYVNIDINGSGANTQTYTDSDIRYMRFWNSEGTKYTYNFNTILNSWAFTNGGANGSDGSKTVYCELIDYAGNVSVTRLDSITKDTAPPVVSSFSINNGATTATSSNVTLNSTLTADAYAMRISNDGGTTWSGWYGDSTAWSWGLETANGYNGYGTKKVMVQFTDYAGYISRNSSTQLAAHDTDVQDSIFYGTPILRYADKGRLNDGRIYTYYQDYEDMGDSSNTYYIYYSTTPTGTKYQKGSTTNSSYFYSNTYNEGTIYYLHLRVYNANVGWSNYSSYKIGFSSDITVVYDDLVSEDISLANRVKSRLTYHFENNYTQVVGTFPQLFRFRTIRTI